MNWTFCSSVFLGSTFGSAGFGWGLGAGWGEAGFFNNENFKKYKNIKAAVFGHIHQESVTKWNNIDFYSTPSTFVQFKPLNEDFAFDEIEPGYRCLHLKPNGQFETEVKRVKGYMPKINKEISGF